MLVDALAKEWSYFFPRMAARSFTASWKHHEPLPRQRHETYQTPGPPFPLLRGDRGRKRRSPRPVRDWIRHGPGLRWQDKDNRIKPGSPVPLE